MHRPLRISETQGRINRLILDAQRQIKQGAAPPYLQDSVNKAIMLCKLVRITVSTDEECDEVYRGAHVRLQDNGNLFKTMRPLLVPRDSSHYATYKVNIKDPVDGSIRAPGIFNEVVFGTYTTWANQTYSWYQFEARGHVPNPAHHVWGCSRTIDRVLGWIGSYIGDNLSIEKLLHYWSYVQYRVTGLNVGPYGYSSRTEHHNAILGVGYDVGRGVLLNLITDHYAKQ